MAKTLLIATTRKGKLKEFKEVLKDLKFKLLTLKDINFPNIEPKEEGKTFKENAAEKARFYGKKAGLLTLADDTGLEVFSLPHKLGTKTRRYAHGSDQDRNEKLLKEMKNFPEEKRKARFITVIAFFDPKTDNLKTVKGVCQGKIARKPKGTYGFGYDPIFIISKINKYSAELNLQEKVQVSSRGKALQKIKKHLVIKKI